MNTLTLQFHTIREHPKFERRSFRVLLIALLACISLYGVFLGKTVVSVVERRMAELEMAKIGSAVSSLEADYLSLSANIDLSVAQSHGFVESKRTAYAVRGDNTKSFAMRP